MRSRGVRRSPRAARHCQRLARQECFIPNADGPRLPPKVECLDLGKGLMLSDAAFKHGMSGEQHTSRVASVDAITYLRWLAVRGGQQGWMEMAWSSLLPWLSPIGL